MTLEAAVLAAALRMPIYKDDRSPALAEMKREQVTAVANWTVFESKKQTITSAADWAALMLTIADMESGLSLRIHLGRCLEHECDRGRARGLWQNHAYGEAKTNWESLTGIGNTATQARVASSRLQVGFYTCQGSADWLTATINGFAGHRCDQNWDGLGKRVKRFREIRASIEREIKKPQD